MGAVTRAPARGGRGHTGGARRARPSSDATQASIPGLTLGPQRLIPGAILVLLLLVGCQTWMREADPGPWIPVQAGGTLTLSQPIPVPQDRARVFFLGGRLQPTGANQGPSCGIEIRTIPRDGPHLIPAGTYTVTRVQPYWTQVAASDPDPGPWGPPLRLASATDGGGTPLIQEGYHLWLGGGPDPDVIRLTCLGLLDEMWRARPPTLMEIRSALGDLASLDLGSRRTPRDPSLTSQVPNPLYWVGPSRVLVAREDLR